MSANTAKNNTDDNSQFGTLVRKRINKEKGSGCNPGEFDYFTAKDRRMRFNNAKDPIYYVFDCIENRPVQTLAKEFVKDSFFEIANFVSKVVG